MATLPRTLPVAAWRWTDRLLGAGLAGALAMAALTAWSSDARAQRVEGDGQAATEQRALGDFSGVQTAHLQVVVRQGPSPRATVQADRNLLPLLETVVQDSAQGRTLVVRWKSGVSIRPVTPPRVTVEAPTLERLAVQGSGDLIGEQLKMPKLQAAVKGSGDLRLEAVSVEALDLEVTGSGDVLTSGRAARLQVRIAGSGNIDSARLRADDVAVAIVGSGTAVVDAHQTLAVSIAGSGDVRHSGPAQPQTTVTGSGRVRRR